MRLKDKSILEHFFKTRSDCFKENIEDPEVVERKLLQTADKIKNSKVIITEQLFVMATLLNHYREISFFAEKSMKPEVLQECRDVLDPSTKENMEDEEKAFCLLALGMSYIPFIRGTQVDVFGWLDKNGKCAHYFDNAKKAMEHFNDIRSLDLEISLDCICNDVEEEIYKVWQESASEYHLSDYVYTLYLNTKMNFRELETLNERYLREIEGLGDEWKAK